MSFDLCWRKMHLSGDISRETSDQLHSFSTADEGNLRFTARNNSTIPHFNIPLALRLNSLIQPIVVNGNGACMHAKMLRKTVQTPHGKVCVHPTWTSNFWHETRALATAVARMFLRLRSRLLILKLMSITGHLWSNLQDSMTRFFKSQIKSWHLWRHLITTRKKNNYQHFYFMR